MPCATSLRIESVAARHCVLDFLQDARARMFAGRVDTDAIPSDLQDFEQTYASGTGRMLAAYDPARELLGTIAWRAYDHRFAQLDFSNKRVVEVARLFVAPEHRRQGIADALFQALREQATELGIEVLYLHTHPFLPGALEFWQRHGFEVICRDTDPQWQTIHMQCPAHGRSPDPSYNPRTAQESCAEFSARVKREDR